MNSLTDPKGIKATVNEIYEGGRNHPLAHLARLINEAIEDAQFQGLAEFDVARWVAHAITEDQKARIAEADKTAPHGKLVPNPPAPKVPTLSVQALSEVLRPNPSAAARALIDQMGPDAYNALVNKHMTPTTEDLKAPKPLPNLDDVNTPGNHHAANSKYPDVSGLESRILNQERPGHLWDFLNDLPPAPKLDLPRLQFEFGTPPKLPIFDLSDDMKAEMKAAGERFGEVLKKATNEFLERDLEARTEAARKLLAEQPHEHIYGRGSNGICRICGHESNSRRQRAKRRAIHNEQAKAARQYPQHAIGERVVTLEANPSGIRRAGVVKAPADHTGMVRVLWDGQSDKVGTSVAAVHTLSAPASRLHEALKAKGDGGE